MSETAGVVTGVHIFPIKSCREATVNGELPAELTIGLTGFTSGFAEDRGIVIADSTMLFASQRGWDAGERVKYPKDRNLARVAVDIKSNRYLEVSSEGFGSETIDLVAPNEDSRAVNIFGTTFYGFDVGDDAAKYFSKLLEREVRLFMADFEKPRTIKKPDYHRSDAANEVAAADGFPFLLTNQASLDAAHELAGLPLGTLPLGAYRGNIEIDGVDAWAEDSMRKLRIGNFSGYVMKACSRCPIPNQDQQTGEPHNLSNKLLRVPRSGWRNDEDPELERPKQYFGQNLNHTLSSIGATVAVGMDVVVEEWGEPSFQPKNPISV